MTDGLRLRPGPACGRCGFSTHTPSSAAEGYCEVCRSYRDETGLPGVGQRQAWRLDAGGVPVPISWEQIDRWTPGRHAIGWTPVRLKGCVDALLMTNFVVVDYWPEQGLLPLLFETQLVEQARGRFFDDFSRRYVHHEHAVSGHREALARLRRMGATW